MTSDAAEALVYALREFVCAVQATNDDPDGEDWCGAERTAKAQLVALIEGVDVPCDTATPNTVRVP